MGYDARIIADSLAPCGSRLTTFEISIPKWIQAELNTHRMLSRGSASSRAIPVKKMLDRIINDPVIPVWWGKNQAGMQAYEELEPENKAAAENIWRLAGDGAIKVVKGLLDLGLHKQIANRLTEPWMFTSVIVSGTQWQNVFNLRCHKTAQPEFRKVAIIMRDLYELNKPEELGPGEWHTPYISYGEYSNLLAEGYSDSDILQISAGKCARVSYLTHDGVRDPKDDISLCRKLISDGHMSPLEHVAQALSTEQWQDYSFQLYQDWMTKKIPMGNFWGFRQLRKSVPNEHEFIMSEAA